MENLFKPNLHHTDCGGKKSGPGNLEVPRYLHEIIHQTNADVLRKLDIPTKGFCGDSFTLKKNNIKI